MKKSRAGFWVGVAAFFLAAVYSVVLFLLKPSFDITAWVLYGATMVAFLLVSIQAIASVRTGSGVIMDTTLGIVTAIYFGLQLIFGGIVCLSFSDVPLTPVIVCEIILLAVYLIIAFMMYAAQSSSAAQDHNDQKTVQKMRLLESDIQGMIEETKNPEVKRALKDLAESIHYSDVVSLPGLADVEGRIAQNVAVLQDELTDENADPLARIETLRRLLKERDRTAAILKR
jgi:hypothetical protein